MSLLITGASGYLGGSLMSRLSQMTHTIGWQSRNLYNHLETIDIRDKELVRKVISKEKPEAIIHTAAKIDGCDDDPTSAIEINVEGTRHIANIAHELKIPIVYISTAAVFDGKRGSFRESDIPTPQSVYGQTKWKGEQVLEETTIPFLILRPSFLVGTSPTGSHRFYPRTLIQLRKGNQVEIDHEWQFTPSTIEHIAGTIKWWLPNPVKKIIHVTVSKTATKYKLIKDLAIQMGLDPELVKAKPSESGKVGRSKESQRNKEQSTTPLNLLESEHLGKVEALTLSYERMIIQLAQEARREYYSDNGSI